MIEAGRFEPHHRIAVRIRAPQPVEVPQQISASAPPGQRRGDKRKKPGCFWVLQDKTHLMSPGVLRLAAQSFRPPPLIEVTQVSSFWHNESLIEQPLVPLGRSIVIRELDPAD